MPPPPSINMVNIHYVEGNYSDEIKLYRMELDQIPQEEKLLDSKYSAILETPFPRLESTATRYIIINLT